MSQVAGNFLLRVKNALLAEPSTRSVIVAANVSSSLVTCISIAYSQSQLVFRARRQASLMCRTKCDSCNWGSYLMKNFCSAQAWAAWSSQAEERRSRTTLAAKANPVGKRSSRRPCFRSQNHRDFGGMRYGQPAPATEQDQHCLHINEVQVRKVAKGRLGPRRGLTASKGNDLSSAAFPAMIGRLSLCFQVVQVLVPVSAFRGVTTFDNAVVNRQFSYMFP